MELIRRSINSLKCPKCDSDIKKSSIEIIKENQLVECRTTTHSTVKRPTGNCWVTVKWSCPLCKDGEIKSDLMRDRFNNKDANISTL